MLDKIISIVLVLYIVFKLLQYSSHCYHSEEMKEGMEGMEGVGLGGAIDKKYSYLKGIDLYDDFYSNVYDNLLYSAHKDKYVIKELADISHLNSSSNVLDIGCGTGNMVNELFNYGIMNVIGLDISKSMIKTAKKKFRDRTFIVGDALNRILFPPNLFSHIFCDYFTYYYFSNKHTFFKNCFYWLRPNGYLLLHTVDKYRFDPVVPPANPLYLVNAQKYAKKRITKSRVSFYGFDYSSHFIMDNTNNDKVSIFKETFKNKKSGNVRTQEHHLFIEPIDDTLEVAQMEGFTIVSRIDLVHVQYEYQYIYILHKQQ